MNAAYLQLRHYCRQSVSRISSSPVHTPSPKRPVSMNAPHFQLPASSRISRRGLSSCTPLKIQTSRRGLSSCPLLNTDTVAPPQKPKSPPSPPAFAAHFPPDAPPFRGMLPTPCPPPPAQASTARSSWAPKEVCLLLLLAPHSPARYRAAPPPGPLQRSLSNCAPAHAPL